MSIVVGLGVALVLLAIVLARSVVVVAADHVVVVERLGRVTRTLRPGLHLVAPGIERVRARLPVGEIARPLPRTTSITLDNRPLDVEGVVRLRVVDPVAAITEVADYRSACVQAATTVLREEVATMTHDDARESSRHLATRLTERLGAITTAWGIQVAGCDLSVKR